ncbi:hypothetical protein L2089_15415 [Paenibacillus hunanensis]|uniref:hypothetical protein n=1 Tax=Paenibacillus hunanensis TaxID=539262 RepID=UPI002025C65A|nr:hypothetical protein [Paenibacillus hunanensis]MCL9662082.1 hypothetical protein [Paenibacillus hunanensis]
MTIEMKQQQANQSNMAALYYDHLYHTSGQYHADNFKKDYEDSEILGIYLMTHNLVSKEYIIDCIRLQALAKNTRYEQYLSLYPMLIDDSRGTCNHPISNLVCLPKSLIIIDSLEWLILTERIKQDQSFSKSFRETHVIQTCNDSLQENELFNVLQSFPKPVQSNEELEFHLFFIEDKKQIGIVRIPSILADPNNGFLIFSQDEQNPISFQEKITNSDNGSHEVDLRIRDTIVRLEAYHVTNKDQKLIHYHVKELNRGLESYDGSNFILTSTYQGQHELYTYADPTSKMNFLSHEDVEMEWSQSVSSNQVSIHYEVKSNETRDSIYISFYLLYNVETKMYMGIYDVEKLRLFPS